MEEHTKVLITYCTLIILFVIPLQCYVEVYISYHVLGVNDLEFTIILLLSDRKR